jgi:hypothetical protein
LRVEDVVKMNPDTGAEARQNTKEEKGDIAAGFCYMGGVD